MTALRIGGFTPFTSLDYPGRLAAVVFCQGCPWRCVYCHNPHLLPADAEGAYDWQHVLSFLERRRGLLDAVVFSGGEPTLQSGLTDAMRQVKALGFRIGLHTAGIYPERLARTLPLVDWIGFDMKAPFAAYPKITGLPGSGDKAAESLDLVLASGMPYEVRCTWHPDLLSDDELATLADELRRRGVDALVVQEVRNVGSARGFATLTPEQRNNGGIATLSRRFGDFTLRPAL